MLKLNVQRVIMAATFLVALSITQTAQATVYISGVVCGTFCSIQSYSLSVANYDANAQSISYRVRDQSGAIIAEGTIGPIPSKGSGFAVVNLDNTQMSQETVIFAFNAPSSSLVVSSFAAFTGLNLTGTLSYGVYPGNMIQR
jgi:hypothetical protein